VCPPAQKRLLDTSASIERRKVFDMSRRAASFTQADVARALRAAEQVAPGRMVVEIAPGGIIRIRPSKPDLAAEKERVDQVVEIDL
jgi:hypothetical protein